MNRIPQSGGRWTHSTPTVGATAGVVAWLIFVATATMISVVDGSYDTDLIWALLVGFTFWGAAGAVIGSITEFGCKKVRGGINRWSIGIIIGAITGAVIGAISATVFGAIVDPFPAVAIAIWADIAAVGGGMVGLTSAVNSMGQIL